jgi:hypothetical protein
VAAGAAPESVQPQGADNGKTTFRVFLVNVDQAFSPGQESGHPEIKPLLKSSSGFEKSGAPSCPIPDGDAAMKAFALAIAVSAKSQVAPRKTFSCAARSCA